MNPKLDLVGEVYGRLTVLRYVGMKTTRRMWECRCECGKIVTASQNAMRVGATFSCGCSRVEDSYLERFESKIYYAIDGCWYWLGAIILSDRNKNRALFKLRGKMITAARVSYALYKGEIGDKHVLHTCDNANCVNPNHLYLGTHQDNMRDRRMRPKPRKPRIKILT